MIILAFATEMECRSALAQHTPSTQTWPAPVRFGDHNFQACVVGIGPVAAALSIGALLERFRGTGGIVNLGICGSFDPGRMPLGSPCVASAEIWPEYGVHGANEETFSHQMFPDLNLVPVNRLDLDPSAAAKAMGLTLPEVWTTGPSLTVAGVSADPQRTEALHLRHGAATENMEGFSLALAARRQNIPFLEVRTVSNPVGSRDKAQWNFRLALNALGRVLASLTGKPS